MLLSSVFFSLIWLVLSLQFLLISYSFSRLFSIQVTYVPVWARFLVLGLGWGGWGGWGGAGGVAGWRGRAVAWETGQDLARNQESGISRVSD